MLMYLAICLLSFVLSVVCGFVIIPKIMAFCQERKLYDVPDARKVHKNAIPRLGGVSFMPSMLVAALVATIVWVNTSKGCKISISPWSISFALGLAVIYITGLLDDIFGLQAKVKFIIQVAVSCLLPISWLYLNNFYGFCGIHHIPFLVGAPLTVIVLVFVMNAINLIDGIDGLSASLSLIALGGFFYAFFIEQLWIYSILIAGLMGVLIPYMYYNIWGKVEKHQKIFMGDSGSLTLGYILGVMLIKFCMHNPNVMPYRKGSMLLSITLLIVPIFDVMRVIIVRLQHRKPIFGADKNHIHHKLIRAGLSHHKALISIIALSFFFVGINLLLFNHILVTWIICIDMVAYILFHYGMDIAIRKKGNSPFAES
ncbi:MraY family glycosyltransferase [Prevotella dentasini]|uniref:MraY family glycosyltransferase n=1 Tax=Prevotella dentasini TaxID=589537 RepID=UPI000469F241|nr:MraY family glycosyltransferase [Prevotella dentasini]